MDAFWQDLRFGVRLLWRSPGLFLTAVVTLALGIGANSAVFSVVNSVLLKPLPYPEADRLVMVYDTQPALKTAPASFPKYTEWRDQNTVFAAIGGAQGWSSVLTERGEPERLITANVTASLFKVFQVPAQIGRWVSDDEDRPGGAKVVVLTYGLWQRRFAADPKIVGQTLVLDGVAHTVVGVMPSDFTLRTAEAFIPLQRAFNERERGNHFLQTFARLRPGVTVAQAQREMVALGRRLATEHDHNHGIDVRSMTEAMIGDARTPLLMLLAVVTFVLLIACTNVANLLLARAAVRKREIAVRTAIGAGRLRLVRQFVTESLALSAAGGVLGLLLAWGAVKAFVAYAPPIIPRVAAITVDGSVLLFTSAIALATGIAFGLAPLLHASANNPGHALNDDSGRAPGRPAARLASRVLVVTEIALSVVLVIAAGLMVKSLLKLGQQDIGFVPERVVAFDVALPRLRYDTDDRIRAFYDSALTRIAAVPGVQAVGATSGLPFYNFGTNGEFQVEGKTLWKPNDAPLAEFRAIGGEYFKAMRIRFLSGRPFDDRDGPTGTPAAIINESLARRCWPGESALGKRLSIFGTGWREVVGVTTDVLSSNPGRPAGFEVSVPIRQVAWPMMTFTVRAATSDPLALMSTIRREVAAIDPLQPLSKVQTVEEVVSKSIARPRLLSVLTSSFALLAGILAMVGVYGLIAYTVTQRRQEFGIRMAIGAGSADVHRMVLASGMKLAAVGVAIGLVAASGLTRLVRSLLFHVEPSDPAVLAGACVALLVAALVACYVPARSAAHLDPIDALRT